MIEEPGSFSGSSSSPRPDRGPEPSHRTSFAIFMSDAASVVIAPCENTSASCAARAAKRFGAARNGSPVSSAIFAAALSPNPGGELRPVPTAVPPMASSCSPCSVCSIRAASASSCATYPENSCPSVSGTASWRWVRPIFTIPANSSALRCNASRSSRTAGSRRSTTARAAATCMAVGNVSLELCDMFTSSFGWTGDFDPISPPASSMARFEMTSFAFMFDWVPEPVCHT